MKRIMAALMLAGGIAAGGTAAHAGSGNDAAIRAIQSLRVVDFVDVIDFAGMNNPSVWSMRAMPKTTPLTPLQQAIIGNPALVSAISAQHWSPFDLQSVYAARVVGNSVYIYQGEPPLN